MAKKKLEDIYFDLKFSGKQLMKQVKQKEKEIVQERKKAQTAFAKGSEMIARMHAENAIRKKNEIPFIIKLASNIDSVASHVQTAIATHKTMNDLSSLVTNLDKAVQVMDSEKIATIMAKFGEQCEDLKQQSGIMDSSMVSASATTIPSEEVDSFLRDIATEREICLGTELESMQVSLQQQLQQEKPGEKLTKDQEKSLEERLAKLRG